MFDFTREVILNSIAGVSAVAGELRIQRVNNYKKTGILDAIYLAPGTAAVKEVSTLTLPAGQTAGIYRFELDVQTSGSYPIDYDRWAINKGKPFTVEFEITTTQTTADNFATTALPLIKKGLLKYHGESIKDVVITKGTGTIIVTAANEFLRFVGATITKLDQTDINGEFLPTGVTSAITTAGKEGFGTAWTLTKNLRIPTQEATRFMGENQDETPVAGVIYDQFTFEYTSNRAFTGAGAVGQTLSSRTTHVLWVPASLYTAFVDQIEIATIPLKNAYTKAVIAPTA